MRKIKRFVLNDSFTVLSAEAQKNVLGGLNETLIDGCSGVSSSSSCSGVCIAEFYYTYWVSNGSAPQERVGGWTKDGYCDWNSSNNSCFCNVK